MFLLTACLGGSVNSQQEFLDELSHNRLQRNPAFAAGQTPKIADNFALSYTYYNVWEEDPDG